MTNAILRGKPDAGNPHVRFDEGEVASAKPRRGSLLYKMKNSVRVYKTSKLYTSLYGRAAYEAWKAREEEIDALRMSGKYSKKEIAKMYEDNLRQLKSVGEKSDATGKRTGTLGEIRVAA